MVTLLYFASLRESLGCSRELVPLPIAGTVRPGRRAALARCALDGRVRPGKPAGGGEPADGGLATPLKAGDEVAFFPPVTGG